MGSTLTLSRPGHAKPEAACTSAHPDQDWSAGDIVRHVMAVHHAALRNSLADLHDLPPRLAGLAALRGSRWDGILRYFVQLHEALSASLDAEESKLFPMVLRWEASDRNEPPPAELLAVAKVVARSHARCLRMLWRLLQLTQEEMPVSGRARDHQAFSDQLNALGNEYEQHLFEVECLLLPIIEAGVK